MTEHDKHKDTDVEDASTGKTGKFGTLAEVMFLIESGADINARDSDGRTPLGWAAEHGDPRCINALIEAGARVNSYDGKMRVWHSSAISAEEKKAKAQSGVYDGVPTDTPLHRAARRRSPANVKALIFAGADIDARQKCEPEHTSLHIAARSGSPMTVGALLGAGADIAAKDYYGGTALHVAAESESPATIKVLLRAGADIRAQCDWFGSTALHRAATNGDNPENIRVLLDAGIRVDARTKSGETPLHSAARNGTATTINALLNAGANIEDKDEYEFTALHLAAQYRAPDNIRAILDAGAAVNARDDSFRTALHRAAAEGHAGSVTALLEAGADMDLQDMWGATPLHSAAEELNSEAANILLSAGADPDARDGKGRNALKSIGVGDLEHFSAMLSLKESVRLHWRDREKATMIRTLAAATANIDEAEESGRTALHLAAIAGTLDFVDRLTSNLISDTKPLDIGEMDAVCGDWVRTICTVLIHAQKKGMPATISALMKAGASSSVRDNTGWMPLHYAAHFGIAANMRALIDAGAPVNGLTHDGETPLHLAARANWLHEYWFDREHVSDVLDALRSAASRPVAAEGSNDGRVESEMNVYTTFQPTRPF